MVMIAKKGRQMRIIDEEISDILSAHGERIFVATLKVMAIATTFCVGVYLCSGWIPAIQATTLPLVVRKAAVAARQAGVSVAAATRDTWMETTTQLPARDPSRQ
jgi:hypothetical protein